ncbi:hypothetical protein [Methylobacterium sp. Leaf117]|uniref:hypothetical protein n=1 Tax=Methylobacterium sp. Leaf117 TaxID=1736260 RepID=UPI0006FE35DA|nr:hypothetical protein [Methylobacterium sp. Leaf117]KQP80643.1 hypothetical protein ASF57_17420 [Methylobacterium sp. Leaf117]
MPYTYDPVFGPNKEAPIAVIPVSTSGVPLGGPYTKAVVLTPGTPVAAGRGVIVKGSGTFGLKLQGGGTVAVSDATGGAGTVYDGFAVIDADMTGAGTGAAVQILY